MIEVQATDKAAGALATVRKLRQRAASWAAPCQRDEHSDLLRELVEWPADLQGTLAGIDSALQDQPPPAFVQTVGEELQCLFGELEALLACLRGPVDQPKTPPGLSAEQTTLIDCTRAALVQIKCDTLDRWPWPPTAAEETALQAERERGEDLSLEAAFAEIAGVDPTGWLQRVAARKQEKQNSPRATS